ncbi:hypothetical protein RFI_28783 [Reticulomyxa filosa]|uniref:Uncharacterized protein n=1 Tax=Reticulomyxa filosa TaxID=46433 RepID=X6M3U9_RETFI|nr:hypothetical protein RFI_28783 [Reticulomyxa filosa]|eukprot:ETO08604.1 hypothetical protein RFI_28783 [Reticulomyxa filosa]
MGLGMGMAGKEGKESMDQSELMDILQNIKSVLDIQENNQDPFSVCSKVDDKLSLQLQTTHSSPTSIKINHPRCKLLKFQTNKKKKTIEDTKSKIETYGNEEQIQLETGLDMIETDNKTKKQAALEDIESLKDQTADKTKIENVTEEKISETTKTDSNTDGTSTDNTNQVLLVFFFHTIKKKK